METAADVEMGETGSGEAWPRKLEDASIGAWTPEKTDPYLPRVAARRHVTARAVGIVTSPLVSSTGTPPRHHHARTRSSVEGRHLRRVPAMLQFVQNHI